MSKKRRGPNLTVNYVVLTVMALFAVLPLIVLFFNSVKSRTDWGLNPLGPPSQIHLDNFATAWTESNFGQTAFNSVILVAGTVLAVLTLGGLAAYGLARMRPKGSSGVMVYMLVASTLPIWLYMVPLFFLFRTVGLLNSRLGLILIYTGINLPFAVFLLRAFLLSVSDEIEDAARVDGANRLQVFVRIILPITTTGFLTVGLVVALAVWGEFQIALVMIQDASKLPVTTSFNSFATTFGRDWTLTSAVAVMMILPVLVFFLAFQRQFTAGLTQGSVKG